MVFREGYDRGNTEEYKENFRGDGYVYYLTFVDIFMGVYIGQNLVKYVLFIVTYFKETVYKTDVYAINKIDLLFNGTPGQSMKAVFGNTNEV